MRALFPKIQNSIVVEGGERQVCLCEAGCFSSYLGVFWTVPGRDYVDTMIPGIEIIDFRCCFAPQNQIKFVLGSSIGLGNVWERGPQSVASMLHRCVAYDIGNRILLCSFLSSSNLLIANADLCVENYESSVCVCIGVFSGNMKVFSGNVKAA